MKDFFNLLVDAELVRAREKFPFPDYLVTALAEEAGEATRASLNVLYAAKRFEVKQLQDGSESRLLEARQDLRKELIQTMAMCVRLWEEGDPVHKIRPLGEL